MKILTHPEALLELRSAKAYYKDNASALVAKNFIAEFKSVTERLKQFPNSGGFTDGPIRRCALNRYPYTVHYDVLGETIFIVAIAHQNRVPDYWRDRL